MSHQKIIVGYDGSAPARTAAAWALDHAARTASPVEFLYAFEEPLWMPAASMVPAPAVRPPADLEQSIAAMLDQVVSAARRTHPGVDSRATTVRAYAGLTLIDRSADAGLIVIGCRGHSAVAELLGSVSAAVSAHARCPVVVVRGDAASGAPVVAGIDGSETSAEVLTFAAEQAAARAVPLRVIGAFAPVTAIGETGPAIARSVNAEERKPFDDLVGELRSAQPGIDITADAVIRHPAAALTEASATAQLLVVGSRGRGVVRGLLLGSVSQHLLRHSACTVAVIH
ncbi:nucleotide-binding universal stress UspA family protein [Actinoplanes octamycinicus]|uniref:Nucleotide-binding universal stress UspA family protein n=1 Tax=Actinoplanes octamycinicus TaxID=135948 RepID=A0A7W7H335_9ACTN|nr:universal stress protein [Actinoplanes octamycinicus]MBB4742904.1 nucleotide-binding universal stress UspA family protein [Actinoplanes octamycinicus]GIE58243.1 universal stress protein [Actinoplanes octamycinicus]